METRSSPSMAELRVIAAERGLKYYMHLSKPELFDLLQRKEGGGSTVHSTSPTPSATPATASVVKEPTAAHTKESLVRPSERAHDETAADKNASSTNKRCSQRLSALKRKAPADDADSESPEKKRLKRVINTHDPIMLTELGPHTFEFVRSNGSIVVYNVETLVQYILATGDFSEPQTRIPFSDDDLQRIDTAAKSAQLDERSVLEAKHNKHEFEEKKVKRDGLLGLERCAGEFVTKMLQIVESDDPEEGELELLMDVFPSFSDIFDQIRRNDKEYSKQCMNHFKAYVRGPKNRPTTDRSGLLDVIVNFLEDVANGQQGASAFGF